MSAYISYNIISYWFISYQILFSIYSLIVYISYIYIYTVAKQYWRFHFIYRQYYSHIKYRQEATDPAVNLRGQGFFDAQLLMRTVLLHRIHAWEILGMLGVNRQKWYNNWRMNINDMLMGIVMVILMRINGININWLIVLIIIGIYPPVIKACWKIHHL